MSNLPHHLPRRRSQAQYAVKPREQQLPGWLTAFFVVLILCVAVSVRAQGPRIGLSADPNTYVDTINVESGQEFELYAMVTGFNPGEAMNQPVSSLPWVIHQVCCGALVELIGVEYNPALTHIGHPLAGVTSSVDTCLDQDSIWLATLRVSVTSPNSDGVLWAAGPFGPIVDCDGEVPFFSSMQVTINLEGTPTPTENSPWSTVKAMYR